MKRHWTPLRRALGLLGRAREKHFGIPPDCERTHTHTHTYPGVDYGLWFRHGVTKPALRWPVTCQVFSSPFGFSTGGRIVTSIHAGGNEEDQGLEVGDVITRVPGAGMQEVRPAQRREGIPCHLGFVARCHGGRTGSQPCERPCDPAERRPDRYIPRVARAVEGVASRPANVHIATKEGKTRGRPTHGRPGTPPKKRDPPPPPRPMSPRPTALHRWLPTRRKSMTWIDAARSTTR